VVQDQTQPVNQAAVVAHSINQDQIKAVRVTARVRLGANVLQEQEATDRSRNQISLTEEKKGVLLQEEILSVKETAALRVLIPKDPIRQKDQKREDLHQDQKNLTVNAKVVLKVEKDMVQENGLHQEPVEAHPVLINLTNLMGNVKADPRGEKDLALDLLNVHQAGQEAAHPVLTNQTNHTVNAKAVLKVEKDMDLDHLNVQVADQEAAHPVLTNQTNHTENAKAVLKAEKDSGHLKDLREVRIAAHPVLTNQISHTKSAKVVRPRVVVNALDLLQIDPKAVLQGHTKNVTVIPLSHRAEHLETKKPILQPVGQEYQIQISKNLLKGAIGLQIKEITILKILATKEPAIQMHHVQKERIQNEMVTLTKEKNPFQKERNHQEKESYTVRRKKSSQVMRKVKYQLTEKSA
jgi:hypothetical protein